MPRSPLLLIGLAVLAVLVLSPRVVQAQNQTPDQNAVVWSADMLVVEYTEHSIGAASADLFSNIGGTGDLEIRSLWSHVPNRDIRLAFHEGITDADDLTLIVGDLTLEFPPGSSGNGSFKWTDVDVDWEDGQTISVSIVLTSALQTPASNTPASGAPTISGTAQVDETLTAETSSIADDDGLTNVSYSYQWTRSDGPTYADLAGETGSTYTLVYADQGKTVKVKVTFTDDADNDETLTSEATEVVTAVPNRAATGEPTISGTPQVDQTLTAATSHIADEDGLDGVSYNYQWMAGDVNIDGATGSTYVPANGDVGKIIKVSVSFTDDRNKAETRTSVATTAVLATVPTQPLSLTVTPGDQTQELDASWQAPSSNGGADVAGYKVQWKGSADSWDTAADVSEATVTGTTHTITGLTGGVEYAVRVIATNTAGDGPASDEATGTPAGATSQQNTGDSTSLTFSSLAITSDTGDDDSTWDDDGVYVIGDAIETTVTFSDDVAVTGAPQLELDIGGAARAAEYKSTEGSKIVFSYTVAEGDSDTDGIAISENKLTLNGGTIKDADDNAANLAHDALAAQPSHKVDGIRPTISVISLGGSNTVNQNLFILGEVIPVSVLFTEEIILDGSPQITLDLDSGPKVAHFEYIIRLPCAPYDTESPISISLNVPEGEEPPASGSYCLTSDTRGISMVFSYTVAKGDLDTDGLGIAANALSPNGGTIRDTAGNDAVITHEAVADSATYVIDGVPPEITSIEIFSDPGEDDTYAAGDTIKLNITFSERLEIDFGTPRLRLDIGGKTRMAYRVRRAVLDIQAGETGYIMAYSYTVADGDNDEDGISIPANAVHRLWADVKDINGNDAILEHEAIADDAEHKVATTAAADTDDTQKTGLLTISGTLQVGETVSADFSNLTDDDGVAYAASTAHYAWSREGGGLYFEAMRNPSYVIAAADEGKKLRVDITFFDDNGDKEYLRSPWTEPVGPRAPSNSAPTGLPTITGPPQVDQTLTADTSAIADEDGLDDVSYSYQWIRSDNGADTDIAGETDSTYMPVLADQGKTIKVKVTFTDDDNNAETLTSVATEAVAAVPNREATGLPTISGTAKAWETLTAVTSGIADADGMDNSEFSYQWVSNDGNTDTDIQDATDSTYVLTTDDVGKAIKVKVTFTDDSDNEETLTSAASAAVTAQASRYLEDHHGNTMTTASGLEVGVEEGAAVRETGVIYPADDIDYFRFTVTAMDAGQVNLVMYEIAANSEFLPYAKSVLLTESGECAIHDCDLLSLRDDMVYLEEGVYYLKVSAIEGTDLPDSFTARRVYGVAWEPLAGTDRFEDCVSTGTSDSDPYFGCQTSLLSQAEAGHGMNVAAAWEMGAYGDGVVVNLVDVGVNPLHSDLVGVVDESRSGSDVEGRPIYQPRYSHGTKMAGIIAAQHNRVGGRGVAPGATILSYSPVSIGREMHTALKHEHEDVAVSNNSWGWISLERPHSNLEAIEEGVLTGITDGFHGKGTLYVFPTTSTVNSNMSSAESFYAILPVCGVGEDGTAIGEGNNEGGYGDNLWVCAAYAGYAPYANTRYTKVAGLSTATASASGVAALVRGVNPELTWRDVKLILAESAHRNDPEHPAWMPAGNMYGNPSVNYHFNPNYGFGLIDAAAAVALAQDWVNLPPMETARIQGERVDLPDMASVEQVVTVVDDGETTPLFIEHVEVRLEIRHQAIRDLSIELVSPGGIVSKLLWPDAGVPKQGVDFARYSMGSTRFMGQNPAGEWTLRVADHIENRSGTIYSWSLIVRGHRPPNSPATGLAIISGTAQVDEMLTAGTSDIADEDGLTNVSYSYQWIRSNGGTDTDIVGETDSTYTLVSADQGKTIKVKVTFTDDAENQESLTSAATAMVVAKPNTAPTGLATISGTAQVDETLTAGTSDIADEDGLTNVSYSYQWIRSDGGTDTDIVGETNSTYTLVSADQGKTIKVKVTFTDDADNQESLTSPATATVVAKPNTAPTGLPTISGTAQVDETLTADTSDIADDDGLTDPTFTYQWVAGGADISGATSSTYFLTSSEQGQTIQVQASFTDDADNQERLTSEATAAVAPRSYGTVWSADMLVVEYTETSIGAASADLFSNIGGSGGLRIQSLWSYTPDRDLRLAFEEAVPDADDLTVIVGELELAFLPGSSGDGSFKWTDVDLDWEGGQTIAVRIVLTSTLVEPTPNTPATGLPTISGTAQVDQTLTAATSGIADEGGLTSVSYSYQWIRSDGNADTDIAGETASTYTLVSTDEGKTIKVRVSFTDDAGNQETLTSAATSAVLASGASLPNNPATGAPTIDGTAQVGEMLTANTSDIADEDGLASASYSYQWMADATDIEDATDSTYTPSVTDVGKAIKVRVSFTDDRNNAETRTSVATATVLATVPTQPLSLTVAKGDQIQELDASWQAPSSNGGSTVTGYKVQWKEAADSWGTEADVSEATVTGTTHTITGLTEGVEYTVRVMAVNDVGEGAPSSEASGTPQEEPIWSATLTVGVAEDFAGYTIFLPNSNVLGALSSDTITLDDASYTVKALGVLDGKLILSVMPKLTAGFVLVLGTDEFASTDASAQEAGSLLQFQWNDPGLDLPEGEEVAVRLTAPDDNSPATGLPTINGTPQVGVTLTAGVSGISDEDGLTNVSYRYQWIRSDGNTNADIEDATDSTYEASNDDLGQTIKVKVTFTDDANNEESLTSEATVTVAARSNAAPTGLPTISGPAQVDETLAADTSAIADEDGLTNVSYSYQWIAGGSDIDGAIGSSYTLTSSEQGQTVQVRVTFTDDADNTESLTSEATETVAAKPNSEPTGLPTISGTPQVEQTLTADTSAIADEDGLTNVSYSYQWIAGGSDIDGATNSTYTPAASDVGKAIQVRASFEDDAGNAASLTSAATEAVAAKPTPLTASFSNVPDSHDGQTAFTFELRFSEEFGISYVTLRDHAFTVTGGTVNKAKRMTQGSNIGWTITVTPGSAAAVTVVLPVTTDCNASGAVCTADGSKLSNRLEFTVSGPSG